MNIRDQSAPGRATSTCRGPEPGMNVTSLRHERRPKWPEGRCCERQSGVWRERLRAAGWDVQGPVGDGQESGSAPAAVGGRAPLPEPLNLSFTFDLFVLQAFLTLLPENLSGAWM